MSHYKSFIPYLLFLYVIYIRCHTSSIAVSKQWSFKIQNMITRRWLLDLKIFLWPVCGSDFKKLFCNLFYNAISDECLQHTVNMRFKFEISGKELWVLKTFINDLLLPEMFFILGSIHYLAGYGIYKRLFTKCSIDRMPDDLHISTVILHFQYAC